VATDIAVALVIIGLVAGNAAIVNIEATGIATIITTITIFVAAIVIISTVAT